MTTGIKKNKSRFDINVLKVRNFRMLLATRMLIMMALQSQSVIVGWQIYSLTGDAFMLGLTGLAEAIPAISCAFFAGHVVDVGKPHRIYITAIGILALNTITLASFAGGYVTIDKSWLLYLIYFGIFLSGLARAFVIPASFTMLSLVVKREEMPAAAAWLGTGFQTSSIIAPAAAGLIYGGYGPEGAWLLPSILLVCAFVAVNALKVGSHPRGEKKESAIKSITAGWKFIWEHKVLLSMMALDMFAVLFGGAVAMLPAVAEQILHAGPQALGALRAAPAMGAIFATLFLALNPMKKVSAVRLLWVVAGFGICMLGFGLSKTLWISMVFLALSGIFDSISMTIRGTLMQLLTPDHMRGRVSSISSMFIISSNEIGAFESGTAAKLLGLGPSIIFGGIGTLLVTGVIARLSPQLRRTVVEVDQPKNT